MTRTLFHALSLCLLMSMLLWTSRVYGQAWVICHENQDYNPYITYSVSGEDPTGLLIDVITRAAADSDVQVSFSARPWKRCLQGTQNGSFDALFGVIKTPEREQQYAFPMNDDYLAKARYTILYKASGRLHAAEQAGQLFNASGLNVDTYKQLKQYGLQAPAGYVLNQFLIEQQLNSEFSYSLDNGIKQVALGRLDGYLVERLIGLSAIQRLGAQGQVISSQGAVKESIWHIPFNRDFYQQNQNKVDEFWHHVSHASRQIIPITSAN
ncbi:substrate-binding periplasmic protein [Alteromonas facilis]|uniref:substrate-binding periplasmic protein n=1 Tax=Alteromonas facilis TaxID=2048004 RepID=UPI000C2839A9|nr:transporter substrate-binding domain-containing protein [Alteromonas facilis]